MNCTEKLSEIATKLDEMADGLYKSGVIGYSMSLRTMSKSIKEVIESVREDYERADIESYLASRNAGMTLW